MCYRPVTDEQGTVTDSQKVLPLDGHGNATVTPTVTLAVQGFQPPVTDVTVKSQTLDISVADRQPEVGDTVEVISNDAYGVAKGARGAVAEVCAAYGVKLSIPKVGTGKGKPDNVITDAIKFKDVRVVIVR